jgi:hypothetical protein
LTDCDTDSHRLCVSASRETAARECRQFYTSTVVENLTATFQIILIAIISETIKKIELLILMEIFNRRRLDAIILSKEIKKLIKENL